MYMPNQSSTDAPRAMLTREEATDLLNRNLCTRFGRHGRNLRLRSGSNVPRLRDLSATMGPNVIEGNVTGWKRAQDLVGSE